MFKAKHQPELIDLDDDEEPGPSSASALPSNSRAAQPAEFLQRAANRSFASQVAMQLQQPGSSAGPSRHARQCSLYVPIIDLSESEAAAGLPPMHGSRDATEQRDSLDCGKQLPAKAEAGAPGTVGHPSARRRPRQDALEDGDAGPVWLDGDDRNADASLKWSASAAPKRRRSATQSRHGPSAVGMALQRGKDASDSPALDVHGKAPVKAPRLGGLQSNSRPEDILDLTGMADIVQRSQKQQATGFIDLSEPQSKTARVGAANLYEAAPSASGSAARAAEAASEDDCQAVEIAEPMQEPMLIESQDPMDLLQLDDTLEAVPEELKQELQGVFSCAICFDEHSLEDCYIARVCGHRMCRDAAREVVLGAVRSCSFPVLCPICQAKSEPRCIPCSKREAALAAAQEAGREDIPSGTNPWCCTLDADIPLLLTVEEEEHYLERSLKAAANSCADLVPCPQANCEGVAVAGPEDDSPALVCNACKHVWCGKCNVAWHSNKSCDDYQRECGEKEADKGMEEYKRSNRMIKCPTCGHGIEKIAGCNRVQCSGCKTQCCWLCGKKLPALNPYSHFTDKGCGDVGGGAQAQGTGVPAGAWAVLPGEKPRPAAQQVHRAQAAIQQAGVGLDAGGPARGLPAGPVMLLLPVHRQLLQPLRLLLLAQSLPAEGAGAKVDVLAPVVGAEQPQPCAWPRTVSHAGGNA
ncbi:g5454 [Coccomyxa viridis]|uniref:RBR-type E3 ubiquitin transferase n=1 Tax=Coccomyxa viridis TaxID=1274662 RepID=A0ABP1FWU4_9CHLO